MDGVLIFSVCFRSLVHAGTLHTILDYLDGKGQVRASCLSHQAQGWEMNAPAPGEVIQLCPGWVPADKSLLSSARNLLTRKQCLNGTWFKTHSRLQNLGCQTSCRAQGQLLVQMWYWERLNMHYFCASTWSGSYLELCYSICLDESISTCRWRPSTFSIDFRILSDAVFANYGFVVFNFFLNYTSWNGYCGGFDLVVWRAVPF